MTRLFAFAASSAAALAHGVVLAPAAHADCSLPSIAVSSAKLVPGASITVTGSTFGTACNDVGPTSEQVLGDPAVDIDLILSVNGSTSILATVDADADYAFTQRVNLPSNVTGPGEIYATLADGYDTDPVTLTIRREHPPAAAPSAATDVARPAVVQTDSQLESEGNVLGQVLGCTGAIALIAAALGIGRSRRQGASRPAH